MRRRTPHAIALFLIATGCAAPDIGPPETEAYLDALAAARATPDAPRRTEPAVAANEAASALAARAAGERARIAADDVADGILDLAAPASRAFLARLAASDDAFTATRLDLEQVLLAVYARNPGVAAARAERVAAATGYEQAAILADRALRLAAFRPADPMRPAAPLPGADVARADMIAAEVAMARETSRMRLLDAVMGAADAYHVVTHHTEELRNRGEQLALAARLAEVVRSRVASGAGMPADLLMAESDRAMAADDRDHAAASLQRSQAELNAWFGRDPAAPLSLEAHEHRVPPDATPALAPLLALAKERAPAVRMAAALAARADAAVRMQEAMLVSGPDAAMRGESPAEGDATLAMLRARRAAADLDRREAVHATERRVVAAHYELDSRRRMYAVAAKSAEPLAAAAEREERRFFESGGGSVEALLAAARARLAAAHDVISARHEYFAAEAALWAAVGARPEHVAEESR